MTDNIYIDFETNKAGDFYCVSNKIGNADIETIILCEGLRGAAIHHGYEIMTPMEFFKKLENLLINDGLIMTAFTRHELNLVKGNIKEPFQYLDIHKAGKKWINCCHRDAFNNLQTRTSGKWSLESMIRLTELPLLPMYSHGKTTERFNAVIKQLSTRDSYNELTSTVKGKFTKAIKHNQYDVDAIVKIHNKIRDEQPSILKEKKVFYKSSDI